MTTGARKFTVRKCVFNMPMEKWKELEKAYQFRIDKSTGESKFTTKPISFYRRIGLVGGLSALYNESEKAFFEELYRIAREKE